MNEVKVPIGFLKAILREMEQMWDRIDFEHGPAIGGLDKAIESGHEPVIAALRQIVVLNDEIEDASKEIAALIQSLKSRKQE